MTKAAESRICAVATRANELERNLHLDVRGTVASETADSFEGRFGLKQTNNVKIKAALPLLPPLHSFTLLIQNRYLKYSPDFWKMLKESLWTFINSTM